MAGPFRHKLAVIRADRRVGCTCGRNWDTFGEALKHVRLARRWRYLGRMEFYGEPYLMWEHALTGRQYAFALDRYQKETLS